MSKDVREKLYQGITEIDDELIEDAQPENMKPAAQPKKKRRIAKWIAIAACLCLVAVNVPNIMEMLGMGGESGNIGHDEGYIYQSYAGPVFPLTTLESAKGLEVSRSVNYDFDSYTTRPDRRQLPDGVNYDHIIVSDNYTVTNTTNRDKTVTAIYPYAGHMQADLHPTITVNQTEIKPIIRTGSCRTMDDNPTWYHDWFSWENYRDLLEDSAYMDYVFTPYPLLDETVTVYELSEISDGGNPADAPNPTLQFEFAMNPDETSILSFGFDGGKLLSGKGLQSRNFSVPEETEPGCGSHTYIIVRGKDIENFRIQGFADGGCDEGEEIEGVTAKVERFETTLDEILRIVVKKHYDNCTDSNSGSYISDDIPYELFYGEVCKFLISNEYLLDNGYMGSLESVINTTGSSLRALFSTFEITVPAGESLHICVRLYKNGSFDYDCINANSGIIGYDTLTRTGSTMTFTQQSASISNYDNIEIVRQNFGFDPEAGVTSVALDLNQPHYYLEVRRK